MHRWLLWLEDWSGRRPDIYTGSWFYDRVDSITDWLSDYNHWLTGYNDIGPDIWGPLEELDLEVICWQDSPAWQVDWTESGYSDRDRWWAGGAHLKEYVNMSSTVVNADDLREWISDNEFSPGPVPPPAGRFSLIWPTPDPKIITQEWGKNPQWYLPFGLPGHEGLDIRAVNDTPIFAPAAGEVIRVEKNAGSGPYGIHVRIEHDHPEAVFKSLLAHLRQAEVEVGEIVSAGKLIGLADNTGNSSGAHLHLTLKRIGQGSPWMNTSDIVNPTPYMPDLFPGLAWHVDVGGNFRTSPSVSNNLIRFIAAGNIVEALDIDREDGGDWWQIRFEGTIGWFWTPYKLSML